MGDWACLPLVMSVRHVGVVGAEKPRPFSISFRWKRVRIANIVRGYVAELRLVTTLFAGRNPSNFRPPKNGVSMAQFNNNLLWRAPQSRGWEE